MSTLLVGFDSAWTIAHSGAIVGVLNTDDGLPQSLGEPQIVNYLDAESLILRWQAEHKPSATIVLLDQPTIVENATGQRPVENIVASPVGRRYGAVQPANTNKEQMFGKNAPIWRFLARFGGPADPMSPIHGIRVIETYPVLTMIALGWTLPDSRLTGRLPKYNPDRKSFSISDWQYVCGRIEVACKEYGLETIAQWALDAGQDVRPGKSDQDCLDACICLIVAQHLVWRKECLMVGDQQTGYIVVPYSKMLHDELVVHCNSTSRTPLKCVRTFSAA